MRSRGNGGWILSVAGLALWWTPGVLAAPTHTWEAGAPNNGDVNTFPSGIQISNTDLIKGIVPLRNIDLAVGYPNNPNGYVPANNMPDPCQPSPIANPNPGHSGFHGATPDQTGARLTDGLMGVHVDSVLSDFLLPSGVFQFDLPAPTDIGEIRVFVQNTDPGAVGNGRIFQNYDVYISRDTTAPAKDRRFVKLIDRVISSNIVCGPDGMNPNGNDTQGHNFPDGVRGATLTRVFDDASPRLAAQVTSIRFVFWPASNTQGAFFDQWLGKVGCDTLDPLDVDPQDTDGFRRAIEASIVKEIDVLAPTTAAEVCTNSEDDDGDSLLDCADTADCAREPACTALEFCHNVTEQGDPIDDDGDGLANGDDPDCAPSPWPCPPEVCDNGTDDDGNSLIDGQDPDCWIEICDNGTDDDHDEKVDCADPDCALDPACTLVCVHDPVFDVDDDRDVDQQDFATFQTCFTGTGGAGFDALSPECRCMDVTGDAGQPDKAISQYDFAVFEQCATGPEMSSLLNPNCDD